MEVGYTAQMVSSKWLNREFRQVRVLATVCSTRSKTAVSFAVEPRKPNGNYREGYVISIVTPKHAGEGGSGRKSFVGLSSQDRPGVVGDVFANSWHHTWEAGADLNEPFIEFWGNHLARPGTLDHLLRVSDVLVNSRARDGEGSDFIVKSLLRHINHVALSAVVKQRENEARKLSAALEVCDLPA